MTILTHSAKLLVLVAALGFACSLEVQAAKNNGGFQQSAEAKRVKFCSDLQDSYNVNMTYYQEKPGKRGRWKRTADNIKTLAQGNNCDWAQ